MAPYLVKKRPDGNWSVHSPSGEATAAVARTEAEALRIAAELTDETTPTPDTREEAT